MMGTKKSVRKVPTVSPPMTALAIGILISAPSPSPIANGTIAKMVVSAVINTGLNLLRPPRTTASLTPNLSLLLIKLI